MYIHYKKVSCLKRRSIHVKKKLFMYISIKKKLVLCNNLIYKKENYSPYKLMLHQQNHIPLQIEFHFLHKY